MSRPLRSSAGPVIALAALMVVSLPTAQAEFVQTMTCQPSGFNRCEPGEEPKPVRWYKQFVPYRVHDLGSPSLHPDSPDITDDLKESVFSSFDEWNNQDCSEFEMVYEGTTPSDFTGYNQNIAHEDNINVLVWRDDQWPHAGYQAVALTTVTYRPSNGEILSADIEFNTADYVFTDTEDSAGAIIDFRNTLTHEIGHFLGLDHSPNPAATMFATAPPGEIAKRELHPADIEGLCHIYPLGQSFDPEDNIEDYVPLQPDGRERRGWCSSTPSTPSPALVVLVLVVLGLLRTRR